ncbi:hypothetical protein [Hyunsoonleella pacifica]|uniref:Uncharacterized protein n=1 Tax=Hyunsoonleella pacifica TaxID=1080224 RepID=A0A4Q9FND2_9FLAO|nr:hypothetical protein [Hyunsoonleella pacifica]TBN16380.1 hypothetical protein EYD46_06970 [Hyunsoonleella pacifica]GGD19927.1 hypothetical protein GCM10011368_22290 [Hyunsoonleella pacifica]
MIKSLIVSLIVLVSLNSYSQDCNFYKLDGTVISKCDNVSINSIVEKFFNDVRMIQVFSGKDNKNCKDYDIIFQKYTETPLFLLGEFPKNKKKLKKCIESYNVLEAYYDSSFKFDLNQMIKSKRNKEYVKSVFGNPNRTTVDKNFDSEIIIYNYNKYYGTVKFDLIFINNVLTRYIFSN